MNTQHTSKQNAIIKLDFIWLHVSVVKRSSPGQLRKILRYSENITQWETFSFTPKFDKTLKFLPCLKQLNSIVKCKANLQVIYSGLTMVFTLIVLCVYIYQ